MEMLKDSLGFDCKEDKDLELQVAAAVDYIRWTREVQEQDRLRK